MKETATSVKSKHKSSLFSRIMSMQNSRAVRWYVLTLPSCHRGTVDGGLQAELDRRIRKGDTLFEFFAPTYIEVAKKNGTWIRTNRPLLYNYVFVRASENEIYRMMTSGLSLYSFLPRVRDDKSEYYPYLTDEAMKNLQWIARSYLNEIPVVSPEPERLMKGDRVRITEGRFKNVEATVVTQPGVGRKDIMVCVENWMWIPLLHIQSGQYEVISLNTDRMHVYTRLNNDRLFSALHEALRHYHTSEVTEEDRALAADVVRQYGKLTLDSIVMRCKSYALLLPAYTILGDQEACDCLLGTVQSMLPAIRAEQAKALLFVTLYGCTDNSIYCDQAHALVDPWRAEKSLKKIKAQLIHHLDDYDEWLGHPQYGEIFL